MASRGGHRPQDRIVDRRRGYWAHLDDGIADTGSPRGRDRRGQQGGTRGRSASPDRGSAVHSKGGNRDRDYWASRGDQQAGSQRGRDRGGQQGATRGSYASTRLTAASKHQTVLGSAQETTAADKDGDAATQDGVSRTAAPAAMVQQTAMGEQDRQTVKHLPNGVISNDDEEDEEESDFEDDDKKYNDESDDAEAAHEYRIQFGNDFYEDLDYGNYDNDYDDDDDDSDSTDHDASYYSLENILSRMPPRPDPRPARKPDFFDRIPELRKARQEATRIEREETRQSMIAGQKRARVAAEAKRSTQNVEGENARAVEEPIAKKQKTSKSQDLGFNQQVPIVEDPAPKRQKTSKSHGDLGVNQQVPTVEEQYQLFVMNEQATRKAKGDCAPASLCGGRAEGSECGGARSALH